ncbi:hypothetical protein J11TS1_22420 [Oceanobacillus sp. J11TS1]|nr:DUF443 family protein [Oceanobacillus sp. J11TS1]GIO23661.1 hypothetical protein J11TS1_22420 [Oceanobacillus sp. J11TS1]
MQCKVQRVYKNTRFRVLKVGGEAYILDLSQSIWGLFFPFLTWITPNTVYKVDEEEANKLVQAKKRRKQKVE